MDFDVKWLDSMFHRHTDAEYVLLVIYVNDIVTIENDSEGIFKLKIFLQDRFHTKDLGMLRYLLGIEVARSKQGICLSQRKYVLDMLEEAGLLGGRPIDVPMDPN